MEANDERVLYRVEEGTNLFVYLKEANVDLKEVVALEVPGVGLRDLKRPVTSPLEFKLVFKSDPRALEILRHSASHLMAQAVTELFPDVQVGVGPAVDNGYYYDFYKAEPFTPEDLEKVEKKMKELSKEKLPIERVELSKAEALEFFRSRQQNLKVELIEEKVEGDVVSLYKQGGFTDFCRGPHVTSTGEIRHFKVLSSSAAYWKGEEGNLPMQRIYGTAFFDKEALEAHLALLEEAKKRDHRRLGKDLELFLISDDIGPGLIMWLPKGAFIRRKIEDFWVDEHFRRGYGLLNTPQIAKLELWKTSGHASFYKDNMFPPMEFDDIEYQLKPMNCPFHVMVYKSKGRSYRDLPLRWAEMGTVYRYERSGVLHGLLRVRGFTQDDAHLFYLPSQVEEEVEGLLDFTFFLLGKFGFSEYEVYLSTRPEKSIGSDENWERSEKALRAALTKRGVPFTIDPGEGVFYGPKIDIKIKDALGRAWQCTTIQVDFNNPERFDLTYTDESGEKVQPIMIHRALLGSFERFFGVLIEHYAGKFPLWLAPEQVVIVPVSEKYMAYAAKVRDTFQAKGVRARVDERNEKLGYKIRSLEMEKIPYMAVVGEKEEAEGTLSLRVQGQGDVGTLSPESLAEVILEKERSKAIDYEFVGR